jgi:membrane-bound metal-dependent hydrolase YbcI (DUF457 family)
MSGKEITIGTIGFFIVYFVMLAITVFIYAAMQLISAKIVRGKGSLNACTISVLYATAFWPLSSLIPFAVLNHREFTRGF